MKIKCFFDKHFKLTILDISLAGMFTGLWIVVNRFLTFDLGIMEFGITYAIAIVIGLYFKPLVAVLISVISDTISLSISTYGIGFWMWQYAIMYPLLVLFVGFIKWLFTTRDKKMWMFFSNIVFLITIIGAILVVGLKENFAHNSNGEKKILDISYQWSKILIWILVTFMIIVYITLLFFYKKNHSNNSKTIIMVYSIVSAIIVLFIWVWGPYADMAYMKKFFNKAQDKNIYNVLLVARILKTPVVLPLYTIIVYPLYKISINLKNKTKNKWI